MQYTQADRQKAKNIKAFYLFNFMVCDKLIKYIIFTIVGLICS